MIRLSLTFRFLLQFARSSSELEKYDKEEDVYFYFDRSEWLENATKDYVYERVLTEEQRELLIQKYS